MLQYPINVYPDNITLDLANNNANKIKFTFKGDVLTQYLWRLYDYDTETVVSEKKTIDYNQMLTPIAYNNEGVVSNAEWGDLPRDKEYRYIMQFMFTQSDYTDRVYENIYDRFVLRGETNEAYTSGTSLVIEDRINLIYEWNKQGDMCRPTIARLQGADRVVAGVVIEINGVRKLINSYNYATGEIELESAFDDELPKGTPYQLYSNYLVTQQYFFKTLPTPMFTNLNAKWDTRNGVHFTADYSQIQNAPLKYYTITMDKQIGEDEEGKPRIYHKIATTDKRYSQNVDYTFIYDYDIDQIIRDDDDISRGNALTRRYCFTINGVLQNGMKISAEYECEQPEREQDEAISNLVVQQGRNLDEYNSVQLTWDENEGYTIGMGYRVYRYDMNADDVVNSRILVGDARYNRYTDVTVSNHGSYRYLVIPYGIAGIIGAFQPLLSDVVSTDYYGYTITELIDFGHNVNGKPFYKIGDTWCLLADIQDSTITQNTDKVLHVGYGKYSSATSTATNYMSSTFTGALVQPDCESEKKYRDDIALVQAWREFITRDCIYLLRSQKGDVWVVNIVENPTTEYQENIKQLPTTVSFSWAECCGIDEIMTGFEAPWAYNNKG